jgi:uncharacterized protein YeaO (DUF488 family)
LEVRNESTVNVYVNAWAGGAGAYSFGIGELMLAPGETGTLDVDTSWHPTEFGINWSWGCAWRDAKSNEPFRIAEDTSNCDDPDRIKQPTSSDSGIPTYEPAGPWDDGILPLDYPTPRPTIAPLDWTLCYARSMPVRAKSVYDHASPDDGERILITQYWPRGVSRARVTTYTRVLAPSREILHALKSGAISWSEYEARYLDEMRGEAAREQIAVLAQRARDETITLMCVCREDAQCHRRLLRDLIEAASEPPTLNV